MTKIVWVATVVLFSVQCSHARHCHSPEAESAPAREFRAPLPDSHVLAKFDPNLRWRIGDATEGVIAAIALLERPLPPDALDELEARGLTVLSRGAGRLHVQGDSEALLMLAAREEVRRVSASGSVRPPPIRGEDD